MRKRGIIAALALMVLTLTTSAQNAANIASLRKDAAAGNVKAQVALANRLLSGKGVQTNYQEAAEWFAKAAN
ncbi:MAG: SEL1-like repeat protein, partial [Prevotella sp.]|nr:SEL1-like repeat protein [Prevotella sp.]